MKTKPNTIDSSTSNRFDEEEKEFSDFDVLIELDEASLGNVAGGKFWIKL